jgi:hypothetical protein
LSTTECTHELRGFDAVRTGLTLFGAYQIAIALLMIFAPGSFYELVGPFGPQNDHYIQDLAAFELPLGVLMLGATRLPAWRVPVLTFAVLHYGFHAVSHLVDIDDADPAWLGPAELAALIAATVVLALLLIRARREADWASR